MTPRQRRYRFSTDARTDLLEIRAYLMPKSDSAWSVVLSAIDEACRRAARMPGIGHRRADLRNSRLRCLTVFSYLVVYDPESDPMMLIRIIHGARHVRTALKK